MSEVDFEASGVRAARAAVDLSRAGNWLQSRIDRYPLRAFSLLTVLYAVVVCLLSSVKLLWLDELITLHIARLGSVSAIWQALQRGVDPNPSITHLLVHYSRFAFGDHEWAYRLPAFCGYWIGLLSLFLYLVRRLPPTWALGGTALSMTMAAFDYSYESRSYAIFYGLAMLAMLCWSVAVDPNFRKLRNLALGGMILALAAGISTNYFAVLAFFSIGAGELARTIQEIVRARRKSSSRTSAAHTILRGIDFRIWIGLAIAASTLLAYRSLISHAIAQFAPYAWNKVSLDQVFDSYTEMVEIVLYPILALFFLAMVVLLLGRQLSPLCQSCRNVISRRWIGSILFPGPSRRTVPLHEAAAIVAFLLYPFLGYIIASIRGGMLSPRFVIPVCFGFAIAATFVAYRLFGELSHAGAALLCFCLAWFIARESVIAYWYEEQSQSFFRIIDYLPEAEQAVRSDSPLVIPDPLLALTLQHYAPPDLAARVVFPVDFPAIRNFRHDDSPEENLWAGRDFLYSMPIMPLASFQHSARKYLVIAGDGNWLLQDLAVHRYPVRRLRIETRATAIGGFTPLARGTPEFYAASGDQDTNEFSLSKLMPHAFNTAENLPGSKFIIPGETAQE